MRNNSKIWQSLLFLLVVMSFAISSCNEIDNPVISGTYNEGEVQDLIMQVVIPSQQKNQSPLRSIGLNEENAINTIDVLAFRVGSDGKEYFD
jgi:hypothetical protein